MFLCVCFSMSVHTCMCISKPSHYRHWYQRSHLYGWLLMFPYLKCKLKQNKNFPLVPPVKIQTDINKEEIFFLLFHPNFMPHSSLREEDTKSLCLFMVLWDINVCFSIDINMNSWCMFNLSRRDKELWNISVMCLAWGKYMQTKHPEE